MEAGGVQHLCTFAETTGASVYIVHTSCGEAVDRAMEARARGVEVTVEAVAPHLVLDKTYAQRLNFEGAKFVMSPPLRDAQEHEALWNGLANASVSTIGTDHAPFNFQGQKEMGKDAFTLIPNGIPSIQERDRSRAYLWCLCWKNRHAHHGQRMQYQCRKNLQHVPPKGSVSGGFRC